jgi:hypothetical protein
LRWLNEVTAFARHVDPLGTAHERFRVVEGDALRWVSVDAVITGASRISRADVAHFMLSILGKTETYHPAINCSN